VADPRNYKGRWPAPGAPVDDGASSEDTTVLPGLEDATRAGGDEDADQTWDGQPRSEDLTGAGSPDDVEEVEVFAASHSRARPLPPEVVPAGGHGAPAPPPAERPPPLFAPLPEMSAEIWQAGLRALVTVPDVAPPPWLDEAYWRDLGGLFLDELALVSDDEPERRLELTMSAARVAERLGEGETALRLVDDALALARAAPEAWRARARLCEGARDLDGAAEAWRRVGALATDVEEREVYAALDGEWALARRGELDGGRGAGGRGAPSLAWIPDGPARALAEAELALLGGTPAEVAGALEQAAFGTGDAVGAALLEAAARFHEVGGDAAAAAEQRFVAARMDAGGAAPPLGRLRDAARLPAGEIEAELAELRHELGPSALGDAVARWAAGLARARGDRDAAREILADAAGPTPTAALLRDRLDLDLELGEPLDADTLTLARAHAPSTAVAASLAFAEATALARRGAVAEALAGLAEDMGDLPDALPLGIVAEELARASAHPAGRVRGLELWLRVDPARRAAAALALEAAIEAAGPEAGGELAARAALQTAIEAAPGAAVFWSTAARDARAGRLADAAATLKFGADLWAGSRLGAPLAERAAELSALTSAEGAFDELQALATPGPGERERLLTIARGVRRAGASADRQAWLTDQVGLFGDVETRAWWWIQRAQAIPTGTGDERVACLDAALDKAPAHPVALALLLGEPGAPPARAAAALAAAGAATDHAGLRVAAAHLATLAGESGLARDVAIELAAAEPGSTALRELAIDLSRAADGARAAAELVARLPRGVYVGDDAQALRVAEAFELIGEPALARDVLAPLVRGPFAPEARRALARLTGGEPGAGLPLELYPSSADREAADAARALVRLGTAAEEGRLPEIVEALVNDPPHEPAGGLGPLFLAGLLEEAAGGGRAAPLFAAADAGGPARLAAVARLAASPDARVAAAARERAAALVGDGRARAAYLRAAAAAHARRDDVPEDARAAEAARCLRAALGADPEHLPALVALRREAARRRDLSATVEACAMEATVLRGRVARVAALLRAAELARHDDGAERQGEASARRAGTHTPPPRHARALGLFRQALELDPANDVAFEGLRALLEENAAHAVLAEALAARVAVARNPFEITSLRLARAELLAGPLRDRAGAKAELEAVLGKEPQHARALARLSELAYEDGDYLEAGELYLRRAVVERAPEILREVLVRLGRIYTRHVPDAKRAIGAYARVLQTEPQEPESRHEALAALSELYAESGDAKNALGVTEALVEIERDPARRVATLVRCGQLHERLGDLRPAAARFRAAADAAPRDVHAVGELARFLERTRDHAGRRALLDHAVGLLRHDVERGRFDLGTLRALVPLLEARGKTRAAAAGAQLLGAISEVAAEREAARGWAAPPPRGRRLAALARPEVDERPWPPALVPGMRHVFRLVGPLLAKGQADLARHGVARADRLGRGHAARDVVEGVAVELGAGDVDVFLRPSSARAGGAEPGSVRVEPGDRPAVIFAPGLPALGGHALRFAAARAMRLVATHLDLVLAATPADAGALLGGVIRQFVPDFHHPDLRDDMLAIETERVAKLLPRKLKPEVMPFAVESAGAFDVTAVHAAVRDGANAVGLLACGDLPAALAAVVTGSGRTLAPDDIARHPEALALLRFALSDDYDELCQAME
jgi:tetratricopeptide (TPR) repeat protein